MIYPEKTFSSNDTIIYKHADLVLIGTAKVNNDDMNSKPATGKNNNTETASPEVQVKENSSEEDLNKKIRNPTLNQIFKAYRVKVQKTLIFFSLMLFVVQV